MCVIIIALVFLLIFFFKSSIFMFHVFKSQSIKTGLAFCLITASALEIIVKLGINISSFFLTSKAFTAISKAAVPLETATEYFLFTFLENFFSNNFTSGPSEEIHFFFKTDEID